LELKRMKIKFFPITLGPMRMLTARGMKMKKVLENRGLAVIESYPGGAQDILRIPRKKEGLERLKVALMDVGISGDIAKREITHDELDAITLALVGLMYLRGDHLSIGDPDEGLMILPARR